MSKTSSFRTDDQSKQFLIDLHGSVSAGATKAVEAYIHLRPIILQSLKEKFSPTDIRLLAEVLKKGVYDPAFMASKDILASKISMAAESTSDKATQSALTVLVDVVKGITPVQCYFLQEEIFRRIESKK